LQQHRDECDEWIAGAHVNSMANALVNRRRSAKRGGHQHWPIKWRSHGQCWRPR
jgi:hypothetical protein